MQIGTYSLISWSYNTHKRRYPDNIIHIIDGPGVRLGFTVIQRGQMVEQIGHRNGYQEMETHLETHAGGTEERTLPMVKHSKCYVIYSGIWELGTPKGLWKTVLNPEVVLFFMSISVYWIGIGLKYLSLIPRLSLFLRWS